jgi:hypothetical protein
MVFAGALGFSPSVVEADMKGVAPFAASPSLVDEAVSIRDNIVRHLGR